MITLSTHDELVEAPNETLATPRMHAGIGAKLHFRTMDVLYGSAGSPSKFSALEVIARAPHIARAQVSYVAITHTHPTPSFARENHQEVQKIQAQQDNELFHLRILEELLQRHGERQQLALFRVIPRILAWSYYHLLWFLYALRPRLSHERNAQFEEYAEHEYPAFTPAHPALENERWESELQNDYGHSDSAADLLRKVALDERHHKEESLQCMATPRFGKRSPVESPS